MKLGKIPYINTAPYFHFLSKRWLGRHQVISGHPRQLGLMAREGGLDAGPFSLVDALELVESGEFEWLGKLGIAGRGPIQSILLFAPKDLLSLKGKAIAVTPHTATTSRLMEVWLREKVGLKSWQTVGPGDVSSMATLLIGDEALRRSRHLSPSEIPPIDLCEEWTNWTGLPFVFARWAVRKSLPEPEKRELALSLRSAVELALDDLEAVAEAAAQDSAFDEAFIRQYLGQIIFNLGDDELKSIELFQNKLSALTGS
jgi:chorismate dehydratase